MSEKQCSKCKETKPKSEFNRRDGRGSGFQSYCRACGSEYQKAVNKKITVENRRQQIPHPKIDMTLCLYFLGVNPNPLVSNGRYAV